MFAVLSKLLGSLGQDEEFGRGDVEGEIREVEKGRQKFARI